MPANPNWTRWIRASVGSYLMDVANAASLPTIIEELDDRTELYMQATSRAEIRINGPFTQELSANYYRVWVDVNVLVTSRRDGGSKNGYSHLKFLGLFHEAMDGIIPVFKFGLEAGDCQDEDVDCTGEIGCLSARSGPADAIRVLSFGQVEKTDRIIQNAVDARYVGYFSN